jgi:hypothetical protein
MVIIVMLTLMLLTIYNVFGEDLQYVSVVHLAY